MAGTEILNALHERLNGLPVLANANEMLAQRSAISEDQRRANPSIQGTDVREMPSSPRKRLNTARPDRRTTVTR